MQGSCPDEEADDEGEDVFGANAGPAPGPEGQDS
jgi:hypothetical protein